MSSVHKESGHVVDLKYLQLVLQKYHPNYMKPEFQEEHNRQALDGELNISQAMEGLIHILSDSKLERTNKTGRDFNYKDNPEYGFELKNVSINYSVEKKRNGEGMQKPIYRGNIGNLSHKTVPLLVTIYNPHFDDVECFYLPYEDWIKYKNNHNRIVLTGRYDDGIMTRMEPYKCADIHDMISRAIADAEKL